MNGGGSGGEATAQPVTPASPPRLKAAELDHVGPARGHTHGAPTYYPRDEAIGVRAWDSGQVHVREQTQLAKHSASVGAPPPHTPLTGKQQRRKGGLLGETAPGEAEPSPYSGSNIR